jgi:hypothetical protein
MHHALAENLMTTEPNLKLSPPYFLVTFLIFSTFDLFLYLSAPLLYNGHAHYI